MMRWRSSSAQGDLVLVRIAPLSVLRIRCQVTSESVRKSLAQLTNQAIQETQLNAPGTEKPISVKIQLVESTSDKRIPDCRVAILAAYTSGKRWMESHRKALSDLASGMSALICSINLCQMQLFSV
jgi:hypothetical protein